MTEILLGIVIFAKNEYIQECLIKQMQSGVFEKEYIACLEGNLSSISGTINAAIARKEKSIIERCINENGEKSVTHYQLIENKQNFCIVKFKLETGRTHQIRIHSSFIGHPILGDTLYGSPSPLISRQALHAYRVKFVHPITKQIVSYIASIPEDMEKLRNLRLL